MAKDKKNTKNNDREELKEKCQEYLTGWQRAQADYENLKRESDKRVSELAEYQTANLLLEVLPIYDHFKLALKHIPEEQKKASWIEGINHIKNQFAEFLKKYDVSEIKTVGEEFNPELHEAVAHEESDEADNTIIKELKSGYKLGDKVIQTASVVVANNKNHNEDQLQTDEAEAS